MAKTPTLSFLHLILTLVAVLLVLAWFIPVRGSGLTVSFTQDGSVLESADGSTLELTTGATVEAGDRIWVPQGGSLNLVSPDGHNITVSDSATLVISKSSRTLIGDRTNTAIQVEEGDIRVSGQGRSRTSLDIGLPYGVAGVRGTEFNVSVAGEQALLSVHDGRVGLTSSDGSSVALGAGVGAIVTAAGSEIRSLPGSPQIAAPAAGSVVDTQGALLTWTAVDGAARYAVEIATDVGFLQVVARTTSDSTAVEIPALSEDTPAFVRVSAVSADGLRGPPSASLSIEIRLRLAQGLQNMAGGDVDQSITEFQAALPNYPDDVDLLRDLGWSLYLAERYGEAREAYEHARSVNGADVDLLLELGRVYFMLAAYDAATETYQTVLTDSPDDPDALWGLGDTYRATGRTDEALDLLRRCLQLQPDHPYARESLEMITGG